MEYYTMAEPSGSVSEKPQFAIPYPTRTSQNIIILIGVYCVGSVAEGRGSEYVVNPENFSDKTTSMK